MGVVNLVLEFVVVVLEVAQFLVFFRAFLLGFSWGFCLWN